VPSTVVLLGRWNWWPSRMSRISADQPLEAAPGGAPTAAAPGTPASPADPADQQPRQPDPQR
jgi:putative drug exporter of the RND superfamily